MALNVCGLPAIFDGGGGGGVGPLLLSGDPPLEGGDVADVLQQALSTHRLSRLVTEQ